MFDPLFLSDEIMELVFSQILDGLSIGSVLLLAATGLAIVFGLMGVINLAHGEFMMLGAYVTFVVQNMFRPLSGAVLKDSGVPFENLFVGQLRGPDTNSTL